MRRRHRSFKCLSNFLSIAIGLFNSKGGRRVGPYRNDSVSIAKFEFDSVANESLFLMLVKLKECVWTDN